MSHEYPPHNPEHSAPSVELIKNGTMPTQYTEILAMMAYTERANQQYYHTHGKWDDLRSRMKTLKLGNITTNSYKRQTEQADLKQHDSFILFNSNLIGGTTPVRKAPLARQFRTQKKDFGLDFKRSDSAFPLNPKPVNNKEEIKRIYSSQASNINHTFHPIIETPKSRPRTREDQARQASALAENQRTHYCLNAYKRKRNETEQGHRRPLIKKQITQSSRPNNDLAMISLISDADIINRQIVRRKSNIEKSLIEVIEASLLSIKFKKSAATLLMFTMDQTTQSTKFKTYRLFIGPSQMEQLCENNSLLKTEVAELAGFLVDYLEVAEGHLKLRREAVRGNIYESPSEIKRAIVKNPFVRLVAPRPISRARAQSRNRQLKSNHIIVNSQEFDHINASAKISDLAEEGGKKEEVEQNIQMGQSHAISDRVEQFESHAEPQNPEDAQQNNVSELIEEHKTNNVSELIEEHKTKENPSGIIEQQMGTIRSEHQPLNESLPQQA